MDTTSGALSLLGLAAVGLAAVGLAVVLEGAGTCVLDCLRPLHGRARCFLCGS